MAEGQGEIEFLGVDEGPGQSYDVVPPEEALEVGSERPRRRLGRRGQAILLAAALAAAGVWYLARPDHAPPVTFGGKIVDNAARVISRGDATLARYARVQRGAVSAHAGCYFERSGGAKPTDVGPELFCGPVLFFGGRAPAMYLQFPLSPSGRAARSGHLKLDVGAQPVSATPIRLPKRARLERPDRRAVPVGADGLLTPKPPPVRQDALVRVASDALPALPAMPNTALLVSRNVNITLRGSKVLPFFGSGARARSAFPGQKLLALSLEIANGDTDYLINAAAPPTIGMVVDGGPLRPLPLAVIADYDTLDARRFLVASVPSNAIDVELVVRDAGVTQQLSLLTGAPGKGNVKVLQRPYRDRISDLGDDRYLTARVTANGKTTTTEVEFSVVQLGLSYFSFYGPEHASGPDRAFLTVAMCSRAPDINLGTTSACFPIGSTGIVMTPRHGTPIHARRLHGEYTFDVAADFTRGTLTVPRVMTNEAGWTIVIKHPYKVPVMFAP
jgi:hypothetical protein